MCGRAYFCILSFSNIIFDRVVFTQHVIHAKPIRSECITSLQCPKQRTLASKSPHIATRIRTVQFHRGLLTQKIQTCWTCAVMNSLTHDKLEERTGSRARVFFSLKTYGKSGICPSLFLEEPKMAKLWFH